jgi:fatty acid desaturase
LNLVVFPFAAIREVHANKSADIARWRIEQPLLYRNLIAERIATVGSIGTLLMIDWRSTALFLGIPWIIGQWCIVAVNLIQHQECEHQSTYNHSRNLTGAMVNWLFMNNGFHTAHHLRPALHWSLLPKYHWREVAPHIRADLNEPSLLGFLWRYLRECR